MLSYAAFKDASASASGDLSDLLMNWEDFCNEQSMMHDIARARYKFYNYMLALPSILFTTVSGAGNFGVANTYNDKVASFVLGSMALAAGAMFSIHRYMNLPEIQQQHDFYSDEFLKLRNAIRLHRVITKTENRTYASLFEFSKHINMQIDNCIDRSPSMPNVAVNKARIKLGRSFTNLMRMHTDLTLTAHRPEIRRPTFANHPLVTAGTNATFAPQSEASTSSIMKLPPHSMPQVMPKVRFSDAGADRTQIDRLHGGNEGVHGALALDVECASSRGDV